MIKVRSTGDGKAQEVNPYQLKDGAVLGDDNEWENWEEKHPPLSFVDHDGNPIYLEGTFDVEIIHIGCSRNKQHPDERHSCMCGYMNYEANFCGYRIDAYELVPPPETDPIVIIEEVLKYFQYSKPDGYVSQVNKLTYVKNLISEQKDMLKEIDNISTMVGAQSIDTYYRRAIHDIQKVFKKEK